MWYCRENSTVAPVSLIWCLDWRNIRNKRGLSSGEWRLEWPDDSSRLDVGDRVDGGTLIERRSMDEPLEVRDTGFLCGELEARGGEPELARGETVCIWRSDEVPNKSVDWPRSTLEERRTVILVTDFDLDWWPGWEVPRWNGVFLLRSKGDELCALGERGLGGRFSFSYLTLSPITRCRDDEVLRFVGGDGGMIMGCTNRICVSGMTNSGISLRTNDLLLKTFLKLLFVCSVVVGCLRYGSSLGTFRRRHTRRSTTTNTTTMRPRPRPRKAGIRTLDGIIIELQRSHCSA